MDFPFSLWEITGYLEPPFVYRISVGILCANNAELLSIKHWGTLGLYTTIPN